MREFRVISAILIRKRNYKIAFARKSAFAKARSDFGFDPVYDLTVERYIIVREIDISLEKSPLRHQGKPKEQKADSQVHVCEITTQRISWEGRQSAVPITIMSTSSQVDSTSRPTRSLCRLRFMFGSDRLGMGLRSNAKAGASIGIVSEPKRESSRSRDHDQR